MFKYIPTVAVKKTEGYHVFKISKSNDRLKLGSNIVKPKKSYILTAAETDRKI